MKLRQNRMMLGALLLLPGLSIHKPILTKYGLTSLLQIRYIFSWRIARGLHFEELERLGDLVNMTSRLERDDELAQMIREELGVKVDAVLLRISILLTNTNSITYHLRFPDCNFVATLLFGASYYTIKMVLFKEKSAPITIYRRAGNIDEVRSILSDRSRKKV